MDVVYVCRPGRFNEELRYSLRSLQNLLDLGRVWIFGGWPDWVRGPELVRVQPHSGDRYARSRANLVAALEHPEVPERFLLMMDDVFIMWTLPWWDPARWTMHRGPIGDEVIGSSHRRMILETGRWLQGVGKSSFNYETHAPFLINKPRLAQVLDLDISSKIGRATLRTLYGNWHDIGGVEVADFKVRPPFQFEDRPFLSTTDAIFGRRPVGEAIRAHFPVPSAYEGDA